MEHFKQFRDSPHATIEHAFDFTTTGDAEGKYNNLEQTIDAGANEYAFNARAAEQQNFAVWSNRDFQRTLADETPWDRHGEPELAEINGANYSMHRLTRQVHDDLMTHGFYIVKRTEGAQPQAIGFFRAFSKVRPDPVNEDEWATMTHGCVFAHWQALRTHLRAFTAASLGGTLPIDNLYMHGNRCLILQQGGFCSVVRAILARLRICRSTTLNCVSISRPTCWDACGLNEKWSEQHGTGIRNNIGVENRARAAH